MTAADPKLVVRVVGWQLVFSLGTSVLAAAAAPRLLLLSGGVEEPTSVSVFLAILAGGVLAAVHTWLRLRRHRFLLRALTLGSGSIEPFELTALIREGGRATAGWIGSPLVALIFVVVWRPRTMDFATGTSVALLAAIIVAAASLPLHVLLRSAFLTVIELADPTVMREVVRQAEQVGVTHSQVAWRLLAALATPVAFVALGSALIANAHLRRADERHREETARALARAALELGPGVVASAGLDEAVAVAERLGFRATIDDGPGEYRTTRTEDGRTLLTTPLDHGRVRVLFSGSTVPVMSLESVAIIIVAVGCAAALGLLLGKSLSEDLRGATHGVRGLDVRGSRQRIDQSARFRAVADLGAAIEALAARFRIFARAQRQAIRAREAATKMRGLFFASVSHDLKSPLNAILGFTELISQSEPLTEGQAESLLQIERSGRELLALIETVLDAARVEAGQLSLVREPVAVAELFSQAIQIGHDLGGRYDVEVTTGDLGPAPLLLVDRMRMARALATFVGQALRSTTGTKVCMMVRRTDTTHATVRVEVPIDEDGRRKLESLFDPHHAAAANEPRGLALALGLARSVVELHDGEVLLVTVEPGLPAIEVCVPIAPG